MNKKIVKKQVKENYFIRSLKESLAFVRESKKYILWAVFIFLAFALIGFFIPVPNFILEVIREKIKSLLLETQGLDTLGLVQYIFLNNFLVCLIAILLAFIIALVPVVLALTNGYVLGYVCRVSVNQEGIFSLWKLLPHGIFELPGVLIALGLGLSIGSSLFTKNPEKEFFRRLSLALKVLFFIVLPLLVFAAIIEGCLIGLLG